MELSGTAHAGRQIDIRKPDTNIKRQTIVGDSNIQVDQPAFLVRFEFRRISGATQAKVPEGKLSP
jgi:hypothetical protein